MIVSEALKVTKIVEKKRDILSLKSSTSMSHVKPDSYHECEGNIVSGFIAQLVEHRTGNREVTGSNPVEILNFFQASLRNCINCVHCDDHFFIFISFPQFIYDLFHISLTMTQLPIILNSP